MTFLSAIYYVDTAMQSKTKTSIRVAIADNHAVVREGVKSLLQQQTDMEFVGESDGNMDAAKLYSASKPDVFLFEAATRQINGVEILQQIRQFDNKANILIFSFYPEAQYALPYLRAGASGYLEKTADNDTLLNAIRRIASGKKYISHSIATVLAEQLAAPKELLPHEELSAREYQIMLHLAAGKTLTRTAEDMGLSSRTVSTYRKRILSSLNLQSGADLVQYAFRHNLLTPW